MQSVLCRDGEVRDLTERVTLEVMDLDPTVIRKEVIAGVQRDCGKEPWS